MSCHRNATRPRRAPRSALLALAGVLGAGALSAAGPVALLAGPLATPAAAHTRLVRATPADGATLRRPPERVTLRFEGQVLPLGLSVRVTGPAGDAADGRPTLDGRVLTQPLAADLPGGAYTVRWRVSAGDGHPVSGSFGFTVAGPPTTSGAPGDPSTSAATPGAMPSAATPAAATRSGAGPGGPLPTSSLEASPAVLAALALGALLAVGALLALARRFGRPPG